MSNLELSLTAPNGKTIPLLTGLFINNEFMRGSSSETLTSINPATEYPICDFPIATPADVDVAVRAVRADFNHPILAPPDPEDCAKVPSGTNL